MQRTKTSLPFVACLTALSMTSLVPPCAQASEPNPGAGQSRSLELPAAVQNFTVSRAGGHGWFIATTASGESMRVSLRSRFGCVQRAGEWVPTQQLRAGERVEPWGVAHGSHYEATRVRLLDASAAALPARLGPGEAAPEGATP
jgi:hypothetical protein